MQKRFIVNDKEYVARAFDFNTVCDLEEQGISLSDMRKKPMSAVRAYFALCHGGSTEAAGKELERHLINGGAINEIIEAMNAEMEASDFFRALSKNSEEEAQPTPKKKVAKA